MTVAELAHLLGQYPGYLKVQVAPPDGQRELALMVDGTFIDHDTYGWLTLESEEAP